MNGKLVEIDNTDAEGRLILADGLYDSIIVTKLMIRRWYASSKKPKVLVDVATLTGAVVIALGSPATGVYTNTNQLWHTLEKAGTATNDYVWRMPLFKVCCLFWLTLHTRKRT